MPPARPTLLATLALLLAVSVLLFRPLFLGEVFFERDLNVLWYQQALTFERSILAGALPLWDPWAGFGTPYLANPNTQVFYPTTWLLLFFDPGRQYVLYVLLHVLWAGSGQWRLARRLGCREAPALVAVLGFVLSGPFVSTVNVWNHLGAAAWLPWAILAAERLAASGTRRDAAALAAALAGQVLAGSPDLSLFTGVLVAARLGAALVGGGVRRLLGPALLAGVLSLLLPAAQWLPSAAVTRGTRRASMSAAERAAYPTRPLRLAQTVVPLRAHELPLRPELFQAWYPEPGLYLASLYLGASGVPLALAARGGSALALASTAGVATLLALGEGTPFYGLASAIFPPLQLTRYPEKLMIVVAWAWSLLAGLGAGSATPPAARRLAGLLGIALLLMGGAALFGSEGVGAALLTRENWRSFGEALRPHGLRLVAIGALCLLALLGRSRPWPGGVAASALTADLLVAGFGLSSTAPAEILEYRPPTIAHLPRDLTRVHVAPYSSPERSRRCLGRDHPWSWANVPAHWPDNQIAAVLVRQYVVPPLAGAWGFYGSYDEDVVGLFPSEIGLLAASVPDLEGQPAHARLLALGAVSRVLSLHRLEGLEPLASLPSFFPEPILVWGVPQALPRAYAVGRARVLERQQALATLSAPDFDPAREVLLEEGHPLVNDSFEGQVRVAALGANRVELEASLSAPGVVVLVDALAPGWTVTVDERPALARRANFAFRGVEVPAGRHRVEWSYVPPALSWGVALSLLGLAGLAWARLGPAPPDPVAGAGRSPD